MNKGIIFGLLLSGCCSTGAIQVVTTTEPIPVDPVVIEFMSSPSVFTVDVNLDSVVRENRTTVTKTINYQAEGDTVITGENGSARVWFKVDSRDRSVRFSAEVFPDSIPAGQQVVAEVKIPEPSWKEKYFWKIFISYTIFALLVMLFIVRR